jgi:hypothetical protein
MDTITSKYAATVKDVGGEERATNLQQLHSTPINFSCRYMSGTSGNLPNPVTPRYNITLL